MSLTSILLISLLANKNYNSGSKNQYLNVITFFMFLIFILWLSYTHVKWLFISSRNGGSPFKIILWIFPGNPVVKTLSFNEGGTVLIPSQGSKILHASWPKTKT